MWLLKGTLLSIWLFSFGTIAYLYLALFRRLPPGLGSIDIRSLALLTVSNPAWWLAFIGCLAFGFAIAYSWPGKPALWIALIVTELFPVGLLALFLVMVGRLKAMAGK